MILGDIVLALILGVVCATVFGLMVRSRNNMPGVLPIFVLFFLFAWAGGLWLRPVVNDHLQKTVHNGNSVIFCGDLNCSSNSPTYKLLAKELTDCQMMYPDLRPDPTFFSSFPLMRLDHIFHSYHLRPLSIRAIDDWECRLASDHLPVLGVLQHAQQNIYKSAAKYQ